ncbi:type IV secretion system protein VirB3 [Sphingobium yanoikuyae]|uniref:type IV secretion system protein VirB3 n=1 Tax=Sphingobium yanoikuyae TaxID=13690 RepID=UPI0008468D74|nr:VirB3 family type IV secretion system protein [Sphingobium yanoikuyae]
MSDARTSSGQEKLREEILFLAVTRPTMWMGVPIEASLPIAMAACVTLIISGNPLYAIAFGGAAFAIARLVVRHDANAFRLLMLWTGTKARCRNRKWWGGSSYSPLPVSGLRRRGFQHG